MNTKMDEMKTKKTLDFATLIATGSIAEIEDFVLKNFHQIKHKQSFRILLKRLKNKEKAFDCVKASADRRMVRVKQLEKFMIAVAEEVKCLPDFSDSLPDRGNAHIIRAIRTLTTVQGGE